MKGVPLGHRLQYLALVFFVRLLNLLPVGTALTAGAILGRLCWSVLGLRREVSRMNIRQAFPGIPSREADRIGRDSYRNAGRAMVEFARQRGMDRSYARRYVVVEETPALQSFRECRTGVLVIGFHFGNWEYCGIMSGFMRDGTAFLVGKQRNRLVDRYINGLRGAHGNRLIGRNATMRGIVEIIGSGGAVCWLSDQDAGGKGLVVPFFGYPASTPRGAAAFSVKYGIPVCCGFMVRIRGPRQKYVMKAILYPRTDLPRGEAELDMTRRYTEVLEEAVRENPDHYWWPHRRWKTTGFYERNGRGRETPSKTDSG